MSVDRPTTSRRRVFLSMLVCGSVMLSSCSTVSTFLSNLDASSFSSVDNSARKKIPLPPMAEDFGPKDLEPPVLDRENR